uniref:Protein CcmA, bactofilin family n=1 Tax=Candidatus Kentrum sp. FM TaxID=2126340 RepID=A0A450TM59_9GAMM|nr:MAG: protein CcmA, bactofilin family [Candidatus Kentron sp. FM]VFJ70837.1 MAG: protein CcmA, bactofilin family [Candidatus Kentron sp. FM]VFK15769.1 MAG: protein CcmA, bactofilin family [Candidatus Kentron sp. FM]
MHFQKLGEYLAMWESRKKFKNIKTTTLIGHSTELLGDMRFSGGLQVNGTISGNVVSEGDESSVLTLSEHGVIRGDVKVPNVIIYGTVIGNVFAKSHIELPASARITGNVYYTLIEMAMGAEVNGNLVHNTDELEQKQNDADEPLKLLENPYALDEQRAS